MNRLHRRAGALALALVSVAPASVLAAPVDLHGVSPALVRALSLDDVLSMETFGAAALSPDGDWLVFERRRPYDTAPRFDRAHRSGWTVSDLMITSTRGTAAPEILAPREPDTGVLFGSWAPDGRHLLIYRLRDDRLEAGIVSLADRSVEWTGLTPDLPITGAGSAWLDNTHLAMTVHPDGVLPWMLRFDGTGREEMDRRWQATSDGRKPSRSRIETRDHLVTTDAAPHPLELTVLDVETGDRRTLARGGIRDIAPSPSGGRVAILTSEERAPADPSGATIQSAVQSRSRLTFVDVSTGATTGPPASIDVAPNLLRWSADGAGILVWSRNDGQSWGEAGLNGITVSGEVRAFNTEDLLPVRAGAHIDELQIVQADWFGNGAILRARRPDEARFDWWKVGAGSPEVLTSSFRSPPARLSASSNGRALAFADGRLWSISGSAVPRALTPAGRTMWDGQSHTLMEAPRQRANETPRQSWTVAASEEETQVIGSDGAPRLKARRPACDGTLQGRAASLTSVVTVCLAQGVETLRLATASTVRIVDVVNPGFADIAVPKAIPVDHLDRLGRRTTSYLFMPPGLRPDQVKGLLVLVYPGVVENGRYVEATSLAVLGPRAQLLTSGGYAVLSASLPSEAESERSAMMDDFTTGTDLAVDAVLKAAPGLPPERIAIIGHSFGGYTALSIATRSRRYRSYISWAGPTDPASRWGEFTPHNRVWPEDFTTLDSGPGTVEVGQAKMEAPPWADVEGYAAASPYMLADRIQSPVLLITADRDYVPSTQAEKLLTALNRQGKWARLVTYFGEGHTNASPANIRDVYAEIFDWLDRTLGPEALTPGRGAAPMPEPSLRSPPSP
jgi:dipeptidyl aminopeptidase/acylaminoacyl peptidase